MDDSLILNIEKLQFEDDSINLILVSRHGWTIFPSLCLIDLLNICKDKKELTKETIENLICKKSRDCCNEHSFLREDYLKPINIENYEEYSDKLIIATSHWLDVYRQLNSYMITALMPREIHKNHGEERKIIK